MLFRSADEGTGIVHIAPGCGVEDFELGEKLGLAKVMPIDDMGICLLYTSLANKMSVSANELSKRKNAPSFVPDVSIKIDDENNITCLLYTSRCV